jgi:hypothetical protein
MPKTFPISLTEYPRLVQDCDLSLDVTRDTVKGHCKSYSIAPGLNDLIDRQTCRLGFWGLDL